MTRLLLTVILALAAVSVVAITAGADRSAGHNAGQIERGLEPGAPHAAAHLSQRLPG
jgi:hypothetical protein